MKRTRDTSLLLGAQLRTGDQKALRRVLAAYRRTKGDERAAARLLRVPRRTLVNWRSRITPLAEGVASIRAEAAEARKVAAD